MTETVRERHDVENEARRTGTKIHVADFLELSSVKQDELPPELQKYKGRVVVRGNQVRDESGLAAVFSEQASGSSHLQAGRLLGIVARASGCIGQQADAVSAYTQALFYGDGRTTPVDTWISLPPDQRPPSWRRRGAPCLRRRATWDTRRRTSSSARPASSRTSS